MKYILKHSINILYQLNRPLLNNPLPQLPFSIKIKIKFVEPFLTYYLNKILFIYTQASQYWKPNHKLPRHEHCYDRTPRVCHYYSLCFFAISKSFYPKNNQNPLSFPYLTPFSPHTSLITNLKFQLFQALFDSLLSQFPIFFIFLINFISLF